MRWDRISEKLSDKKFLWDSFVAISMLIFSVSYAYLTGKYGISIAMLIAAIPVLLIYLWYLLLNPKIGLITIFFFSYFLMGFYRYYNSFPLGGLVDVLILTTFMALILKSFFYKIDWSPMRNPVVILTGIWLLYGIFELFNPVAPGMKGWSFAVRGYNMHLFFIVSLTMLLFNKEKDLNFFLYSWSILTILAALKGLYQYYFGFNAVEWAWLESGEKNTHILPTGIRYFSFMSDAGQFGATMGQSATVFGILSLKQKNNLKRIYFLSVTLLAIIGMMISGTRGSLFIPILGAIVYIALSKNYKVILSGALLLLLVFVLIKYTNIGNSHYPVRRMRSAFNLEDASYMVRLKHQRQFREYNSGKPFGNGIGSSYHTATRLYPQTYLATFATDSWYWAIFAEQGVVGICIYGSIILFILIRGAYICMFKIRDDFLAQKIKALHCGFAGILIASYVNEILGQFPTSVNTYISIGFIFMAMKFDKRHES
ncbi:MAG: O-antigen ligase domain-containing protein [Bacteroidales bacterium]|nr:O-antigen ligase domain-containing protein [Bacteroidales bacterium]